MTPSWNELGMLIAPLGGARTVAEARSSGERWPKTWNALAEPWRSVWRDGKALWTPLIDGQECTY